MPVANFGGYMGGRYLAGKAGAARFGADDVPATAKKRVETINGMSRAERLRALSGRSVPHRSPTAPTR